jgi:ubiquinone/menaquinone biosynthesis C-methylase UbiE
VSWAEKIHQFAMGYGVWIYQQDRYTFLRGQKMMNARHVKVGKASVRAQRNYVEMLATLGGRNLPPGGESTLRYAINAIGPHAKAVLDLGCNTGWVTSEISKHLPDAVVTGVDVNPNMLKVARRRFDKNSNGLRYLVLDARHLHRHGERYDAVVSAGSTAFFSSVQEVFRSIAAVLRRNGRFIDIQYIYTQGLPDALAKQEIDAFGIKHSAMTCSAWLRLYRCGGLTLQGFHSLPAFTLCDSDKAAVYRGVLAEVRGLKPVVKDVVRRRVLINRLARHRYPGVFTLRHIESGSSESAPVTDYRKALEVMEVFSAPIPRLPITTIRKLNPYELKAYTGDPDCAPGGSQSVRRVAACLRALGIEQNATVVDVGSFTGLSTFTLALDFPNVLGIDIERLFIYVANVLAAKLKSPARFAAMDACQSAFSQNSVDAFVMTATLGYARYPAKLLAEAHRILKPQGIIVEFIYDYPSISKRIEATLRRTKSPHIRMMPMWGVVAEFEGSKFRLVQAERVPIARRPADDVEKMIKSVIDAERRRNSLLSEADVREFSRILRDFEQDTGPAANIDPSVYMCLFRKGG